MNNPKHKIQWPKGTGKPRTPSMAHPCASVPCGLREVESVEINNALEIYNGPTVDSGWEYQDSVSKSKAIIFKWGKITWEFLNELWNARENLSVSRERTATGAFAPMDKTWAGYCQEIGVDKSTANRWLKAWLAGSDKVLLSQCNDWWTPKRYIDAVTEVLGQIDLDPASCRDANETIQAKKYYSADDDGLKKVWFGKVFLNPPYGNEGPPFVEKFIMEYTKGNILEGIILVNSRATDAEWFQPMFDGIICFTDHRIDFDSSSEKETSSTHGSCFIYFGKNKGKFADTFIKFGSVVEKYHG